MFRRITDKLTDTVTIEFEEIQLVVPSHETVAAAILATKVEFTRTTLASGEKRAPYCLMGSCFECLIEIDGVPNQQACMTTVANGMRVKRQFENRKMPE